MRRWGLGLGKASSQNMIRTNGTKTNGRELPLRSHTERALNEYLGL